MRQSTTARLITESNRIYRALVFFTAVLVAGIILLARPATLNSPTLFSIGITAVIVSFVAIALNVLLVRGLRRCDELPPPPNDISDMMLFAEQRLAPVRLQTRDGNTMRLGRFRFTQSQWRLLAVALSDKGWRFTRRNIGAAGIFTSLTAPGIYNDIVEDMTRLGIVDNGYVTGQGREMLCEMAGTPLL